MAKVAGMSESNLGGIERGELDFSLGTVARIAKALKINASELFQGIA